MAPIRHRSAAFFLMLAVTHFAVSIRVTDVEALTATDAPAIRADFADPAPIRAVAAELAEKLPAGARLVLQAPDPASTGLDLATVKDATAAFRAALVARAGDRALVLEREALIGVWREALEFGQAPVDALAREAGADLLVIFDIAPADKGVSVSARAVSLGQGGAGRQIAATSPRRWNVSGVDGTIERLRAAAFRAGRDLASQGGLGGVPSSTRVVPVAPPLAIADVVVSAAAAGVSAALAERGSLAPRAIGRRGADLAAAGPAAGPSLVVSASISSISGIMTASLVLAAGGERVATAVVEASIADLPPSMRLASDPMGRVRAADLRATGEALLYRGLGYTDAIRGARLLARRRLMAASLGTPMPAMDMARAPADLVALLAGYPDAVPTGERWRERFGFDDSYGAELVGGASELGGPSAPGVEARLDRRELVAGEVLGIGLTGTRRRAYVAVYAWQADDSVVRLYPARAASGPFVIDVGAGLTLPSVGEPVYGVAPMPGDRVSVEAVVIVASSAPFDVDALAPAASANVVDTLAAATDSGAFLAAVGGMDVATVDLAVLPYSVGVAEADAGTPWRENRPDPSMARKEIEGVGNGAKPRADETR